MGGFRAAVITDTIQGILIILFSVILIPSALIKAGGFSGLHSLVPDYMFELFGSPVMSEYAWYTILGMVLANLVSIIAVSTGMSTAGSAKDEMTARVGMISGMFTKRLIMIMWALAGLLAIALYSGQISDPDLIWGYMTQKLLFPGAIGLMLIGILAANMSTLDATSVSYSALFIRNLYEPFFPGKSEKHKILIGKLVIPVTLGGGIFVAMYVGNLLELFKYIISVPAIFGAALWLGFIWRRLTRWAVTIQVILCFFIYAIIPNLFLEFDSIKFNEKFLVETRSKNVVVRTGALQSDVQNGRADHIGQVIEKEHLIAPAGIFFESIARTNPEDPGSEKAGLGRFHAEIWIMSWFGIDFTSWTKPGLTAARFFFDAFFPFLLLFLISFVTRPEEKGHLDRFYAKMYTPVQSSKDEDMLALESAYADPGKYDDRKLGAKYGWEMLRPKRIDYIGFFGSWALVGAIIFLLWLVVNIGK
jgi:SSS family solute:Na+ symporter